MTATQRIHPAKPLTLPPPEPAMSTNDHTSHVTVHKNPYVCPSWIVSYGNIHICIEEAFDSRCGAFR